MHTYRIRFELGCSTYEENVEAQSTEAARKLFQARYPKARILRINRA